MDLKIGLVTTWHRKCGIATYSENLSRTLAGLGVEVFIIRMPRFGVKTPELLANVIHKIPKDQIDLIHVQHEYGIWSGLEGGFYGELKRLELPIVTTAHATGMNFMVDRVLANASDKVIVHNEYCRKRFVGSSVVIPHGCLDLVDCPPEDECKETLGVPKEAPLVGYVGFITPAKGLEYVINAMSKVKEAALLIGGGYHAGKETGYMQELKERSLALLPGRVQWLGYVEDEMLPVVYGAMRIVVYPSISMSESGALLMALSHQKAVIASSLKPVREKEKLGALTTFKNVRELRRKIKRLLKDDDWRRSLEMGARRYVEENSWRNVALKHIKLYEEVLAEKAK